MVYTLHFKPRAEKDLLSLPNTEAKYILDKIEQLQQGLRGDIKRLTDFTPEYRLRVGNYRVLFELAGSEIFIYRVVHRRDVYRKRC